MIVPTIGRVIWVHGRYADSHSQAEPALICYVWNDLLINVGGFDRNGIPFAFTSMRLVQSEEDLPSSGVYATWMPYQVKKARDVLKAKDED